MGSAGKQEPRRIAFVADELLGYAGNGIGTTTTFVALALARMGHLVEILFLGPMPVDPIQPEWQRLYEEAGIRVREVTHGSEHVEPSIFVRARDVEVALRADPPDVVIVQDLGAPAYTALRLRQLGLDFEQTSFVVLCHGTRLWITDVSRKVHVRAGALAVTLLERASIELADAVVCPSAYILNWMRQQGWQVPPHTFVIPHVSRSGALGQPPPVRDSTSPRQLERVAFFGRLEERKGIRPFIGALNALEPELLAQFEVEFIGRPTPAWTEARVGGLVSEETRSAIRALNFETQLDQHEALARLRRPGTLAVMPSFAEVFGNTIAECLEHRIPFIASDADAIRELVAPEDHARVLCAPTEAEIAKALRRALVAGDGLRPARARFDDSESLRRWEQVLALPRRTFPPLDRPPAVEVVVRSEKDPASAASEWVLLVEADDVQPPDLVETLARAQQHSGADVVSCGLRMGGRIHFFPGEPGALGLLANGYGTVFLARRSLVEGAGGEPAWPLLARLSTAGAKIVSVPIPLVSTEAAPASLETHPAEALSVMNHFERALPRNLRFVAELATRLAAAENARPAPARRRGLARRVLRRLVRGLRR